MTIDTLFMHLDSVKETGCGKYVARCPAHDDKSPSLAIKDCDDGRVLLHCFAGCEPDDVLAAIGLTFADVMPERLPEHRYKPLRQRFDARQLLATLDHESLVAAIIASDVFKHKEVDEDTWHRLGTAAQRINTVRAIVAPLRHKP